MVDGDDSVLFIEGISAYLICWLNNSKTLNCKKIFKKTGRNLVAAMLHHGLF